MSVETYLPADLRKIILRSGEEIVIGSAIDGKSQRKRHLFSLQAANGTYVFFDTVEIQQFDHVFDNVSMAVELALDAVAKLVQEQFATRNDVYEAIAGKTAETPLSASQQAADAELGRKLRELVGGGSFDLTDSPKSFIETCKNLVVNANKSLVG